MSQFRTGPAPDLGPTPDYDKLFCPPAEAQRRRAVTAANQTLLLAQSVMDQVRDAYKATPGAMLISAVTLNPLEVITIDGLTGQYYRVPVTVGADGSFAFGQPIATTGPANPNAYPDPPGTVKPNVPGGSPTLPAPTFGQQAASRGLSRADSQRIQAAVARGALTRERAEYWAVQARAGHDISHIDQLAGGVVIAGMGSKAAKGAAGQSQEDRDYAALYGPAPDLGDTPDYDKLFCSPEEARRRLDEQHALARHAAASVSDDDRYRRLFGEGGSR